MLVGFVEQTEAIRARWLLSQLVAPLTRQPVGGVHEQHRYTGGAGQGSN
jgi:hypothetical protein